MKNEDLSKKIRNASKWSVLTQICTRIFLPITYVILARILAPEEFGIVATITMIISFADLFTEAGFQKYLIQHEFENNEDFEKATNVAFWTNLILSFILWGIIFIFQNFLADLVGNPGLGYAIVIASIQLPLTSFTSIQLALYQRNFDFKTIFNVQLVSSLVPLLISIPLTLLGAGFWAIIIGNICGAMQKAVMLTYKSNWKPSFEYNFDILKNMLSFNLLSVGGEITIWLTSWADSFLVGNKLNNYYLGIYKNSQSMVNQIITVVQYSMNPILMSTLSRLQCDDKEFNIFFLKAQRLMAYLLFPAGAGIYMYRELATYIVFGPKWSEASSIVGLWAITSVIRVVMVSIYSVVYTAKGTPKFLLILQLVDLAIIVPTCIVSLKYGFDYLVFARSIVRLDLVVPSIIIMHLFFNINAKSIILNIVKPILFTFSMVFVIFVLKSISSGIPWDFGSIIVAIAFYFSLMFLFAKEELKTLTSLRVKRSS